MAKEKALSQQEIDALLNQAQGDTVKPAPPAAA
jgi:flagellar motor switch protein FliM